jgi:hypothetical protein
VVVVIAIAASAAIAETGAAAVVADHGPPVGAADVLRVVVFPAAVATGDGKP